MEIKEILTEHDIAMADVESSYFDCTSNTWDIMSNLFYEYHGMYPHPKYDLLHWFKTKFYWYDNKWMHINEITRQ